MVTRRKNRVGSAGYHPSCAAWACGAAGSALDWQSRGQGFESPQVHQCPVSGHRARLLQDIVHRPAASETVVVSIWLESERPEELTILGNDADVGVGDEKVDLPVLVRDADADVSEGAEVAQGDP